jgi:hypothetical protein
MAVDRSRSADLAGSVLAAWFGTLSRLRGKRVVHPEGVVFRGTLRPAGERLEGTALGTETPVLVRLSRALGLPAALPDLLGLALRVPDAFGTGRHQDALLVSCGSSPLGRRVFLPASGFAERPYTTLLPYDFRGERIVLEAQVCDPADPGPSLGELDRDGAGSLEYELRAIGPGGHARIVARILLHERLEPTQAESLEFDPTNTGAGLELAGALNRLRGPSYRGSQDGRRVAQ